MTDEKIYVAKLNIVFGRPNEKSGRIYTKKQIEQQLQQLMQDPSGYSLFIDGDVETLEHNFEMICGQIKSFQMLTDGTIQARYVLLEKTKMGEIFAALNREAIPLRLSPIMTGVPKDDGTVSDLKIHKLSFDLRPESV